MINAEKYKNELLKFINENEQDFIAFDERDNSIKKLHYHGMQGLQIF